MKFSMNEVLMAMRAKGLHDEVAAVGIVLQQRAELLEALKTMTGLCAVKYGNLDPDVWAEIQKAQDLISNAEK